METGNPKDRFPDVTSYVSVRCPRTDGKQTSGSGFPPYTTHMKEYIV